MDRPIRIVLRINDGSSLVTRLHAVLDLLAEAATPFEVILLASDSTIHALELAHELAIEYPQVRVVEQNLGSVNEWRSQPDCWTYVQDESKAFDITQVRRLCELATTGRRRLTECTEPDVSSHTHAQTEVVQDLRMRELRRRPGTDRKTKLRVDHAESADRVPLPFGTRTRQARRFTGASRPLAFAALRRNR